MSTFYNAETQEQKAHNSGHAEVHRSNKAHGYTNLEGTIQRIVNMVTEWNQPWCTKDSGEHRQRILVTINGKSN